MCGIKRRWRFSDFSHGYFASAVFVFALKELEMTCIYSHAPELHEFLDSGVLNIGRKEMLLFRSIG
jgi:hypothetical protein